MAIIIGPTFSRELTEAGCVGFPFSWTREGLLDVSQLTEQQLLQVNEVLAAHDPAKRDPNTPPWLVC